MQGKIVKGIAGFYYIHVPEKGIYECKAKGIFRNQNRKPLVGDDVEIDILNPVEQKGSLTEILPRKNQLIRPEVANVDQSLVIFAAARPAPNLNLLDRFLVMMSRQAVKTIVCFNKTDIVTEKQREELELTYEKCGCQVVFASVRKEEGVSRIKGLLAGKTTVLAGPSGVGKSSIINLLKPEAHMETGGISEKIGRGKHTTRHSELICMEGTTYLMDTPGFSSLFLAQMEKEELRNYFTEFEDYEPNCRFQGCVHINEPECGIKDAVEKEKISRVRYENYKLMYEELKKQKKY